MFHISRVILCRSNPSLHVKGKLYIVYERSMKNARLVRHKKFSLIKQFFHHSTSVLWPDIVCIEVPHGRQWCYKWFKFFLSVISLKCPPLVISLMNVKKLIWCGHSTVRNIKKFLMKYMPQHNFDRYVKLDSVINNILCFCGTVELIRIFFQQIKVYFMIFKLYLVIVFQEKTSFV